MFKSRFQIAGEALAIAALSASAAAQNPQAPSGIKRLDVLGNLTNKFMRTYTMQVEALARKRRKGDQNITVKHVHVYAGGQAIGIEVGGATAKMSSEAMNVEKRRQQPVQFQKARQCGARTRSGKPDAPDEL